MVCIFQDIVPLFVAHSLGRHVPESGGRGLRSWVGGQEPGAGLHLLSVCPMGGPSRSSPAAPGQAAGGVRRTAAAVAQEPGGSGFPPGKGPDPLSWRRAGPEQACEE